MNYHFFCWDDKFVDGFIELADRISNNNVYVFNFSKPAIHVKSDRGIIAPKNSDKLGDLISNITEDDNVFFHPLDALIGSLVISQIPKKTKIYAIFWGGEFLNINSECGVDNIFGDLLYEPITKKYMRAIANSRRRQYLFSYIKNNLWNKSLAGYLRLLITPFEYYNYFNNNLIAYVREKKQLLSRVTTICHWNTLDLDLLEYLFNQRIDYQNFFYGATKELFNSNKIIPLKKNASEPLAFFIGNSDTPTNNHLDIFAILKRFRRENIMVYAPLSYQSQNYAKHISMVGNKLFGDKFVPIFDFMAKEAYLELLDRMDICVMNHRRTQAAGNINSFLAKGKKVFLNPYSTIYRFLNDSGVQVYSLHLLKTLTVDELRSKQDETTTTRNKESLGKIFGYEAALKRYRELLN